MSFDTFHNKIQEHDTVVLCLGKSLRQVVRVECHKVHQTKYGAFPHAEMIGKEFGCKMYSKNKKGWLYLLHPSPELWTVTLPHRTQILYSTDISLLMMELELRPGSVVVESGTGSGSLSHAFIRTIKPTGHLYTYDFHQQRAEKAREEFVDHDIGQYVTSTCRDVLQDGFTVEDKADAVFLDLPSPWTAIPHAKKALKKSGGRLCSFSPCIEQVQRTCTALRQDGFCDIKTIECLTRVITVRTCAMPEARLSSSVIQESKTESQEDRAPDEKRARVEALDPTTTDNKAPTEADISNVCTPDSTGVVRKNVKNMKMDNVNVLTSTPPKEMPGHTGYLTFASLYPMFTGGA